MQNITISELVAARIAAKRAEDAAVAERRRIDGAIADLLKDANKPEGSISQKADGYKVTVQYGVSRTVDTKKLTADWDKLSPAAQSAFRWKAEAAVAELKELGGIDATVAANYITSKPASPQVKIEAA